MKCLYCDIEVSEDESVALGEYGLVLCPSCLELTQFKTQTHT